MDTENGTRVVKCRLQSDRRNEPHPTIADRSEGWQEGLVPLANQRRKVETSG